MPVEFRDSAQGYGGRAGNGASARPGAERTARRAMPTIHAEQPPRMAGSGAWGRDLNETIHYIGNLISRLGTHFSDMLSLRTELLKEELKESGRTLARDSALLAAGAVLGLFALGVLSIALVGLMAWLLPYTLLASVALAALIVGVLYTAMAGGLVWYGLNHLKKRGVAPERSIEELERDKQWVSDISRT